MTTPLFDDRHLFLIFSDQSTVIQLGQNVQTHRESHQNVWKKLLASKESLQLH